MDSRMSLLREIPEGERPRERLQRDGAGALSDAELLAIFIRTGTPSRNAIEVARDLIRQHGSLFRLSRCSLAEILAGAKGIGPAKACELAAAFELGKRLARGECLRPQLNTPEAIYAAFAPEMQALHQESVRVALLDTKLQLIRFDEVTRGSINESVAHPRELLRPAVLHAAYAFVMVHNHPSGDPSPSRADREFTSRLRDAADLLQMRFTDHVIIGSPLEGRLPYFSFREHGLL